MSLIPGESLRSLKHEYGLIRLLYHRNKNQHRASVWWRHFNGLKRALTKLVPLLEASLTSKKFQRGAQTLEIARYVKFILVKKCYRAFNGIIALGQFITFGMTLVGILSRVDLELGKIEGINDRIKVGNQSKVSNEDLMNVGDDLGEEVGEEVSEEIMKKVEREEKIEKKPLQPNKSSMDEIFSSSKIKKKKKSDQKRSIDDIFREKKVKKAHEMAENVSSHKTKEKKNKKKKSAIDDIFGGF